MTMTSSIFPLLRDIRQFVVTQLPLLLSSTIWSISSLLIRLVNASEGVLSVYYHNVYDGVYRSAPHQFTV